MDRSEAFLYLTKIGKLKTKTSLEIKSSPLSIGMEAYDSRDMYEPSKTYEHLAKLGVKWARLHSGWARTEKTEGQYDFSWLDKVVDKLLSIGIQPWLDLTYGNRIYIPECQLESGWGYPPIFSERAREGWRNYVDALSKHYKGRVRHFEIWNEPDGASAYWKPLCKPDPEGVVRLTKIASEAIRRNISDAVIIGGALANPMNHRFVEGLLQNGIAECIDRLSVHCYAVTPEMAVFHKCLGSILEKAKPGLKIWQGEGGAQSDTRGFGSNYEFPWTEDLQARWMLKRLLVDIGHGLELCNYFHVADLSAYEGRGLPAHRKHCYFGLLRQGDYTPKPSFFAMQALSTLFSDGVSSRDDSDIVVDEETGNHFCPLPVFCCHKIFQKENHPMIVYWDPAPIFEKKEFQRRNIAYCLSTELSLQNPVLVDPLTQDVFFVPPAPKAADNLWGDPTARERTLLHMPYADYPMIVTDRDAVELL